MITVVAAIIRKNNHILITRRLENVHLAGMWEFPGGKVQEGESLEQALKRELLEELGVTIEVHQQVHTVEHTYPTKHIRLHFFECSLLNGNPSPIQVADLRWVEPAQLQDYPFPEADVEVIKAIQTM